MVHDDHTHGCSGTLRGCVHILPLRVYYEDTDAGGLVYHASYLRFAERARTEMMRCLGEENSRLMVMDDGVGILLPVRRCEVDFLTPARLDDALEVHSRVIDLSGASLVFDQAVVRGSDPPLARLKVRIACVRSDSGRPVRLPAVLRDKLRDYVNGQ